MRAFFNLIARQNFAKKESRSPRGFLPRPLLRAGESVAPPPYPQKNSGGAHHFRFRFLDLCIRFGKIISKVCKGFNSGAPHHTVQGFAKRQRPKRMEGRDASTGASPSKNDDKILLCVCTAVLKKRLDLCWLYREFKT